MPVDTSFGLLFVCVFDLQSVGPTVYMLDDNHTISAHGGQHGVRDHHQRRCGCSTQYMGTMHMTMKMPLGRHSMLSMSPGLCSQMRLRKQQAFTRHALTYKWSVLQPLQTMHVIIWDEVMLVTGALAALTSGRMQGEDHNLVLSCSCNTFLALSTAYVAL